jgi:hypothetical protein
MSINKKVFYPTVIEKILLQWGSYRFIKLKYSIDAELEANLFITQIKNSTTMKFVNTSNWNGRVVVVYEEVSAIC